MFPELQKRIQNSDKDLIRTKLDQYYAADASSLEEYFSGPEFGFSEVEVSIAVRLQESICAGIILFEEIIGKELVRPEDIVFCSSKEVPIHVKRMGAAELDDGKRVLLIVREAFIRYVQKYREMLVAQAVYQVRNNIIYESLEDDFLFGGLEEVIHIYMGELLPRYQPILPTELYEFDFNSLPERESILIHLSTDEEYLNFYIRMLIVREFFPKYVTQYEKLYTEAIEYRRWLMARGISTSAEYLEAIKRPSFFNKIRQHLQGRAVRK